MNTPQMFNGSQNFTIEGGNFHNIGRDLNILKLKENRERGLYLLYQHTCTSALFNAEARYPPPVCHPGTRESILNDFKSWIDSSHSHNHSVRWLYGPAGAGKSAIAQTLAETCAKDGSLAGTFFFWRTDPSRNNPRQLFTTIAFQLATSIPELRSTINSVVSNNPSILTSSIETQFDELIFQPCLTVAQKLSSKRSKGETTSHDISFNDARILIIDGLDECLDTHDQLRILSILGPAIQKRILPFRLLIASRPEPRIKEAFCSSNLENICLRSCLNDNYQAFRDIRRFLEEEFHGILERHSGTMEHVSRPWPTSGQIEQLVEKASGHFIYPSTVLKFIDDDGAVPADRLNIVLGVAASDETDSPFAELDALYRQILSRTTNKTLLLRILGTLILFNERRRVPYDIETFLILLQIPLGAVRATLSGAHSLFQEPSPVESNFRFCHASFMDFLLDPKRSLEFFIDKPLHHEYLAISCLDILAWESHVVLHPDWRHQAGWYTLEFWTDHCISASHSSKLITKLTTFDVYAASSGRWGALDRGFNLGDEGLRSVSVDFDVYATSPGRWGNLYRGFNLGDVGLRSVFVAFLADFLQGAFRVWSEMQDKYGQFLQQYHDISTKGVCICAHIESDNGLELTKLPIALSSTFYEGDNPPSLERHILLELRRLIRPLRLTRCLMFRYISPLEMPVVNESSERMVVDSM
ncbi:hypothetical protein GYMLUDRAFT_45607 [Collybiopsis luxurians FD-317 M1]|uniref:Nephrocystin 3-like N-terminal domain-containing protein n=1 Tax=Collybiopsis luxurians FD-317 M1 TaxID=944289 RepID=A0A0D0CR93_9AGAR|nr:hypothetical protein GYMLUDRAFT_45607 [Collybiopsis luxurians FD-317 M1]